MPATIVLLLCLLVIGTFVSIAFVLFFQRKTGQGFVYLIMGLVSAFFFYYGIYHGWIALPEQ